MEKNAVALAIAIALIAVSIFVIQGYRSEGPAVQPGIESQGAKAPELQGIAGYINTEGIKLADLRGKVVLIDFWTYTCINCIRTLPYLNAWYDKYHDKGFEIIGVHTPEFSFEKDYNNVKAAVDKYGIRYPVVQDNDYATWRAYKNNYWPRKYLVDAQGNIRYDHIGEGGYEETEMMIQALLKERDGSLATTGLVDPGGTTDVDYGQIRTPELYLGYQFARAPLGNPEGFRPGQIVPYSAVEGGVQAPNVVYLDGEWRNNADNMELVSGSGSVFLLYNSKDVNIVAGSDGPTDAEIRVDGGYLDESNSGNDILTMDGKSTSEIKNHRLYNIISSESYGAHLVEIKANSPGFRIYTFTFG